MSDHHDKAQEYSILTLEYFLKHKDVVLRKLKHAQTATKKSLEEVEKTGDCNNHTKIIEQYDNAWDEIIIGFKRDGVTENDLSLIETLLSALPRIIKKIYDFLIEQDQKLQALMRELSLPKYQYALSLAEKIQSAPDIMSGIPAKEYDLCVQDKAKSYLLLHGKIKKLS